MSERKQHTAASMREKMAIHYGEEFHHKHNKNHLIYPPHHRPKLANALASTELMETEIWQTDFNRKERLRKMQRRLAKPHFH
ncbi:MAG: hypothetical protein NTW08_04650 [Gammaproteobacteria bacterium]|nr:hypothetical protein [Gammaproteobacteria bacterium]